MPPKIRNLCHAGILFAREVFSSSGDANAVVTLNCREATSVRVHQLVLRKLCTAPRFRNCGENESVDVSRRTMWIIKHYMYSGASKNLQYKDVIPVFVASSILGIRKLRESLKCYLSDKKNWQLCSKKCGMETLSEKDRRYLREFGADSTRNLSKKEDQRTIASLELGLPTTSTATASTTVQRYLSAAQSANSGNDSKTIPEIRIANVRSVAPTIKTEGDYSVTDRVLDGKSAFTGLITATNTQQHHLPLFFLVKKPDALLVMHALTAAYEVVPVSFAFKPDSAMTTHIFRHCVIFKRKLLTIDASNRKILLFDLNSSMADSIDIPCFQRPYGLTLSNKCAFFWSGSFVYEICEHDGAFDLRSCGRSGFEDMKNLRVLRKIGDRLILAINVGDSEQSVVLSISNTADPKALCTSDRPQWFVGGSGDDLFYIENGALHSARNRRAVHRIYENDYFKDSFNVGRMVFLRTRIGDAESKVTVVDMLTGKESHKFNVAGEMKLVQTITL